MKLILWYWGGGRKGLPQLDKQLQRMYGGYDVPDVPFGAWKCPGTGAGIWSAAGGPGKKDEIGLSPWSRAWKCSDRRLLRAAAGNGRSKCRFGKGNCRSFAICHSTGSLREDLKDIYQAEPYFIWFDSGAFAGELPVLPGLYPDGKLSSGGSVGFKNLSCHVLS